MSSGWHAHGRTQLASVLIVDDDSTVCALLERFIRFAGHETASVPDAHAALAAMAGSPPTA